ncbi:MAG: hypothetical protein I3270_01210 [Candidatus Moeniiplasma glomeromycotorum]|nr:hypothetical protein [Candidatus Moeniiplasma glomeromycotorum]MCE8162329.1 hypothetical protein [Candidatus Moeniiplasma glomeromycotorum]MCE8166253.1 hypothetical protein [Candidatus Moeniiplasma glomeromycotorum]MCE8166735.1 hypothetical protein [Candidatus Moeniiplasma glomeromycotorum]
MEVCITDFKKFQGKVKVVNKKEALKGEFWTPPCLVSPIPEGTVYYQIILEKGSIKETLSLPDKKILKSEVKLVFFGDVWGMSEKLDLRKELMIGKVYLFHVQSWSKGYWLSSWEEN